MTVETNLMDRTQHLLTRLDEIGQSLAQSGHALALLGLGSVGLERDRLDAYSDLDFFVMVETGYKMAYINNLEWLSQIQPVVYQFQNTVDGYKLLFADGIFCEFAVFELPELAHIPYAPGQIIWKQPHVPDSIAVPVVASNAPDAPKPVEWLVGEAITNLYVGLCRYQRGEKLIAARFIQNYAVDRILDLTPHLETPQPVIHADRFSPERRYEARFPQTAALLPQFVQGYDRSRESALAILAFLEQHFEVNAALAQLIRQLSLA